MSDHEEKKPTEEAKTEAAAAVPSPATAAEPAKQPEPELTPEQLAVRTEKRAKFRGVYEKVRHLNGNDAFDVLNDLLANVEIANHNTIAVRKFDELEVAPITFDDGKQAELGKEILALLSGLTIAEAVAFLQNHANRINMESRKLANDKLVGDMDIENHLLS